MWHDRAPWHGATMPLPWFTASHVLSWHGQASWHGVPMPVLWALAISSFAQNPPSWPSFRTTLVSFPLSFNWNSWKHKNISHEQILGKGGLFDPYTLKFNPKITGRRGQNGFKRGKNRGLSTPQCLSLACPQTKLRHEWTDGGWKPLITHLLRQDQ